MSAKTEKQCNCEWCVKWSPLLRRVSEKLEPDDKALFEEFLLMHANDSDELCSANSKLEGDWPGWEWMKWAVPAQLGYKVT